MTAALSSIVSGVKPETLITDGCFFLLRRCLLCCREPILSAIIPVCCHFSSLSFPLFIFLTVGDFAPVDHLCDANYSRVSRAGALTDSDLLALEKQLCSDKRSEAKIIFVF